MLLGQLSCVFSLQGHSWVCFSFVLQLLALAALTSSSVTMAAVSMAAGSATASETALTARTKSTAKTVSLLNRKYLMVYLFIAILVWQIILWQKRSIECEVIEQSRVRFRTSTLHRLFQSCNLL